MELKMSEKLAFPVKTIVPSVDIDQIENYSHFSAVRLAKRHFEKSGFAVAEGADFEDNFSLYFYEGERLFCDEYIKVKLGRSHMTAAKGEYCNELCNALPRSDIHLLLTLCRFCSYTGDPGFPDMVLLENGWHLAYVLFDELSASQKIFLLLSKLVGLDVMIIKLGAGDEAIEIDPFMLFNSVLEERRAKNIVEGIEENMKEAEEKASSSSGMQKKIWQDEYEYLSDEKAKNPLFLFKKWKIQGFLSGNQLRGAIHFVLTHSRHGFEEYIRELKNDGAFLLIEGKTEDAMKHRAEYMQDKFGIGRSRSKLLLNFF